MLFLDFTSVADPYNAHIEKKWEQRCSVNPNHVVSVHEHPEGNAILLLEGEKGGYIWLKETYDEVIGMLKMADPDRKTMPGRV